MMMIKRECVSHVCSHATVQIVRYMSPVCMCTLYRVCKACVSYLFPSTFNPMGKVIVVLTRFPKLLQPSCGRQDQTLSAHFLLSAFIPIFFPLIYFPLFPLFLPPLFFLSGHLLIFIPFLICAIFLPFPCSSSCFVWVSHVLSFISIVSILSVFHHSFCCFTLDISCCCSFLHDVICDIA